MILNSRYYPDTISLNILYGENDELEYADNSNQLTIFSGRIDILDGFHRLSGIVAAIEHNSDLNLKIQVAIKNYTLQEAKEYFAQINTINKVSESRIKQLAQSRTADKITDNLIKRSQLKDKISFNTHKSNLHLTTYSYLADSIDEIFPNLDKKQELLITEHLINCFDYLLAFYDNRLESGDMNNQYFFYLYLLIFKKMYEGKIKTDQINLYIDRIDFVRLGNQLTVNAKNNRKIIFSAFNEIYNNSVKFSDMNRYSIS